MYRRCSLILAAIVALGLLPAAPAVAAPAVRTPEVDFNRDGYGDLPIGVPGEDIGGKADAGRVVVMYGSRAGLTDAQGWHQNTRGVPGGNEGGDRYGAQLAAGDLDNDGYTDLAIAAPGENEGSGAVTVLFGSARGLRAAGAVVLRKSANLPGTAEPADAVGYVMTIGNVDTAAYGRELIIGSLRDDGVHVVRHVRSNPTATVIRSGTHGLPQFEGDPGDLSDVGCWLASGNFDGTAGEELVLGQEGDDASCWGWLMRGAKGGPRSPVSLSAFLGEIHNAVIGRDVATGRGLVADGPLFGSGAVDIVRSEVTRAGALDPDSTVSIHQDTPGVPGVNEAGDLFGSGLAVADFNRDGVTDIVAGVPREDIGDAGNTGAVTVVHRRRDGTATRSGNYLWHQNKRWVPGTNDRNDRLGWDVHADDFDGDGITDVVTLSEGERLDGKTSGPGVSYGPGVLTARYSRGGPTYRRIHQGLKTVPGSNQIRDQFGHSLGLP